MTGKIRTNIDVVRRMRLPRGYNYEAILAVCDEAESLRKELSEARAEVERCHGIIRTEVEMTQLGSLHQRATAAEEALAEARAEVGRLQNVFRGPDPNLRARAYQERAAAAEETLAACEKERDTLALEIAGSDIASKAYFYNKPLSAIDEHENTIRNITATRARQIMDIVEAAKAWKWVWFPKEKPNEFSGVPDCVKELCLAVRAHEQKDKNDGT